MEDIEKVCVSIQKLLPKLQNAPSQTLGYGHVSYNSW